MGRGSGLSGEASHDWCRKNPVNPSKRTPTLNELIRLVQTTEYEGGLFSEHEEKRLKGRRISELPLEAFGSWLANQFAQGGGSTLTLVVAATAARIDASVTPESVPPKLLKVLAKKSEVTPKFLAEAGVERAVEAIAVWMITCDGDRQENVPFRRFFDGALGLVMALAEREIRADVSWVGENCFRLRASYSGNGWKTNADRRPRPLSRCSCVETASAGGSGN